ncbi:DEAD/DEAH box helicase family protein [Clostridium ljungdahlii]|uniref:DNA replication protein DnaC n=1 Tax=Clostridium ljungdahlii TaxID=1538 RepID=A0A162L468_9CLOT|nr:DEAD/DEAH box helicase family protein [Clostridium ljungdahlii]OAA90892.1 DNA replication protein DnaC [Clostridium ljungdahlii]
MFYNCKLSRDCRRRECNVYCYPYVLLHGTNGKGGFWATRNTPKKYDDCFVETLPIKADNPRIYKAVINYIENILEKVQKTNRGLYFTGGTGTGKTTTAVTIMNEYLLSRVIQHCKREKLIEVNPVLFVRLSEFQNVYNAQFRGSSTLQDESSYRFYNLKHKMTEVDLLVVDDIALRNLPEGFQNELYEIIDYRATEDATTIFTSNVTYEELPEYVGERIASRVQGMCGQQVLMKGTDHRTGGLF